MTRNGMMDGLELAAALAEHIGTEKTTTRELLALHIDGAERYFREHATKQPQTCVGDALVKYGQSLGITIFKRKLSKDDVEQGYAIVIDDTLPGNSMAFNRINGVTASHRAYP